MNKANVFLLVVVSSLLTYISTATQPAATAGVAQEKWEFTWVIADTKNPSRWAVKRQELKNLGQLGWELFQVGDYGSLNAEFWLRRRIQ